MVEEEQRDPLRLVVDYRERASAVIQCLKTTRQVCISFEQMKVGDYRTANWLFERKTIADFAGSIIDGRLFAQADRLAAYDKPVAIILEGTVKDLAGVGMHRHALQGALISLSLTYQIPILRSRGPDDTAQLLIMAGRQLCRLHSDWSVRHGRRPRRMRKLQLYVLEGLPGIGRHKAAALLDHFGTVRRVVTASVEELCQIRGVNRITAERIDSVLGSLSISGDASGLQLS
jgi:Fanconi anemia group M protein